MANELYSTPTGGTTPLKVKQPFIHVGGKYTPAKRVFYKHSSGWKQHWPSLAVIKVPAGNNIVLANLASAAASPGDDIQFELDAGVVVGNLKTGDLSKYGPNSLIINGEVQASYGGTAFDANGAKGEGGSAPLKVSGTGKLLGFGGNGGRGGNGVDTNYKVVDKEWPTIRIELHGLEPNKITKSGWTLEYHRSLAIDGITLTGPCGDYFLMEQDTSSIAEARSKPYTFCGIPNIMWKRDRGVYTINIPGGKTYKTVTSTGGAGGNGGLGQAYNQTHNKGRSNGSPSNPTGHNSGGNGGKGGTWGVKGENGGVGGGSGTAGRTNGAAPGKYIVGGGNVDLTGFTGTKLGTAG